MATDRSSEDVRRGHCKRTNAGQPNTIISVRQELLAAVNRLLLVARGSRSPFFCSPNNCDGKGSCWYNDWGF